MNKEKITEMLENRIKTEWDVIWEDQNYIEKYWADLASEFKGASEDEVIEFFDTMDAEHLEYISEIGEELFDLFRDSKTFHRRMYELQEKHKASMFIGPPDE